LWSDLRLDYGLDCVLDRAWRRPAGWVSEDRTLTFARKKMMLAAMTS
jgi:hypothetical protein